MADRWQQCWICCSGKKHATIQHLAVPTCIGVGTVGTLTSAVVLANLKLSLGSPVGLSRRNDSVDCRSSTHSGGKINGRSGSRHEFGLK